MSKQKPPASTVCDDRATAYAHAVASGEIVAGPQVRNACARHLRDLEQGPARGLQWNLEAANHAIGFFEEVLCLNGGRFEGQPFEVLPWQAFIIGSLFGWLGADGFRRFRVAYVETAKGSGKSPLAAGIGLYGLVSDGEWRAEVYAAAPLALDTPVPTPSGWTTQGELKVGDRVFDENGRPCKVTYLSPVLRDRDCFVITFDDGTEIVSDANHRWLTLATNGQKLSANKPAIRTTAEIAETVRTSRGRPNHRIEVASALKTRKARLPIDPYVLGVWLGDGKSNRGAICFHRDDTAVVQEVEAAGFAVSPMKSQNNTQYATIRGLRTLLREAGLLDNKHVPRKYLRASQEQRLALLQGLMDTDGTCTKTGECRFTNREERLARAVFDLAAGLGLRAHLREIAVTGSAHWVVSFKAPQALPVFRLSRKAQRQRVEVAPKCRGRYIVSVRPAPSVPVRCIEVDSPSHLYLISHSYIATHNTKKDQAQILFRDAVAMVDQSPLLAQSIPKSGSPGKEYNLAFHKTSSFFRTVSADDGQSGPRPHIALLDEIHEHKTPMVVEMMRAGTKSREQALIFMITNSGTDRLTVCWDYHDYADKIAGGVLEDDSFFGYVCDMDETDDPFDDEACWYKANPSLAHGIPGLKYLREQVTQARGMPSKEATVRRLNFCQWVQADNPAISRDAWLATQDDGFDIDQLVGRRCVAGLDLSSTQDLTSLVLLFEPMDDDPVWRMLPWFWLPEDGLAKKGEKDRVPYLAWQKAGHLDTTPGRAINKRHVLHQLSEIAALYDLQGIGYDRWRIEDLTSLIDDEGVSLPPLVPVGQGFKDMAPGVDEFERRLVNAEMRHTGHPVMTWCAANAVYQEDPAGNRKINKAKSTGRVDGVVAAVMATALTLTAAAEPEPDPDFILL